MSKKENVNHPKHYNMGKFEIIDIIEDWDLGFHLGNAVKYIARARHKGKENEDVRKAIWYLKRYIKKRYIKKSIITKNQNSTEAILKFILYIEEFLKSENTLKIEDHLLSRVEEFWNGVIWRLNELRKENGKGQGMRFSFLVDVNEDNGPDGVIHTYILRMFFNDQSVHLDITLSEEEYEIFKKLVNEC
ncbi:hypothetical protein LCGC14_0559950 [marine sediment metagenome]|uniref:DUF3310 domain-containing protein n=1 Tax=marine sediment metagenome TaxID=412755 RepID=A0A0F9UVF8_9ZZZZ